MGTPSGPARVKKCSRCGADLVCGAVEGNAGCWCEDLPNILPFTGKDCMCPACAKTEVEHLEKIHHEKGTIISERAAAMWTGGKDCSLALHEARKSGLEVQELVTFAPPSPIFLAHPLPFLKRQAAAMGLHHRIITIQPPLEAGYTRAIQALQKEGIRILVTGDIAEVGGCPNWMREVSRGTGLDVLTPLWGRDRSRALTDFMGCGFKAIFSLVKKPWFTREWVGRAVDQQAVDELAVLAPSPDLCGENGEYHSLVLDGPIFKKALRIAAFDVGERDEMMYMEIKEIVDEEKPVGAGLCASCRHTKRLATKGASKIYLCGLSAGDPRFAKYPRLPMTDCTGYANMTNGDLRNRSKEKTRYNKETK